MKRSDKIALTLLAIGLTFYAGAKHALPTFQFDSYLADAGSYATNDTVHVAFTQRAQGLDLAASPVLVYAREMAATNAADWSELSPRRMFPAFPADYTLANATNYNYAVYVDYVPPPTVHTNGVWQMRGIELPYGTDTSAAFAFPNTGVRTLGDYWFWPSEIVRVSRNPQSIWTPRTGIWYGSFAYNGYANTTSGKDFQTFTINSYHNYNQGGYSLVQFFALPAGVYVLSYDYTCEVMTDVADAHIIKYVRSDLAYKNGGDLSKSMVRTFHEEYTSEAHTFTVPDDVLIGIFVSGRNVNGRRGIDVWNVHLIKKP